MQAQAQVRAPSVLPFPTLTEAVIPSVRGEFYAYSTVFSTERPLYFMMKCKANKGRPIAVVTGIDHEVNLVFVFENGVWVCSPASTYSLKLLGNLGNEKLNPASIMSPDIDEATFRGVCECRDTEMLVDICGASAPQDRDALVALSAGTILAVTTESGKYGLLRVRDFNPLWVTIDACHILL